MFIKRLGDECDEQKPTAAKHTEDCVSNLKVTEGGSHTTFKEYIKGNKRSIEEEEESYFCNVCPFKTLIKASLIRHMRTHTGEKPHKCASCPFRASEKGSVTRHMKTRHKESTEECVSDVEVIEEDSSAVVVGTQLEEKPYFCKECPFRSSIKNSLKRHMMTHTGEKPYKCTSCPFRASEKRSVTRHMKTHVRREDRQTASQNTIKM